MKPWLLLSWLLLPLAAGAQGLYKWVDEKGVVHYSDTPPAGKPGQKLNIAPPPPLDSQAPQRSRSWQEQLQDSNERRHQEEKQQMEARQKAREAEQKCLRAQRPGFPAAGSPPLPGGPAGRARLHGGRGAAAPRRELAAAGGCALQMKVT